MKQARACNERMWVVGQNFPGITKKLTRKNNGSLEFCIRICFRFTFHFAILGPSHEYELTGVDAIEDDGIRGSVS